MTNKAKTIKTINGTAIMCVYRDDLRSQANQLQKELDQELILMKAKWHDMKIKINQLNRQADYVQSCISEEMQAHLNETARMAKDYPWQLDQAIYSNDDAE